MPSMKQLTVRGFDDDLAEAIRQLATARRDLPQPGRAEAPQKGRGPAGRPGRRQKHRLALDDLFGSWSQEEAEAFDASLEVFETVDESAWR